MVATSLACGGSTDSTLDGGDDSGSGSDVTLGNDTGNGSDTGAADGGVGDASTDQGTTVDATGPFDPSQLGTNLVLWLEGDKGVTQANNAVSAWADQTSYHNDASGGTGQFAHPPTINATAINNLPAVEFGAGQTQAGTYLTIPDSASLELGAGDFAVFMVAEYTNPTTGQGMGQGTFYDKVAGANTPTGPQLYGNAGGGNQTLTASIRARINASDNVNSTGTTYNDGKYHRIGIRRNGTTLEVWTDGTPTSFQPDAGGNIDVSATGSDVYIGAAPSGNGFTTLRLVGGIAEVVGVKGTLSDGDVSGLDGYFKTKYAL